MPHQHGIKTEKRKWFTHLRLVDIVGGNGSVWLKVVRGPRLGSCGPGQSADIDYGFSFEELLSLQKLIIVERSYSTGLSVNADLAQSRKSRAPFATKFLEYDIVRTRVVSLIVSSVSRIVCTFMVSTKGSIPPVRVFQSAGSGWSVWNAIGNWNLVLPPLVT